MPNVNRIPFIVEDGTVKYSEFRLMFGFPNKLQTLAEKEILDKIQNYQGKTDEYPIGEIKVVDNEYFEIIWDYPSKFEDTKGINQ
jgi:hypothetical protein